MTKKLFIHVFFLTSLLLGIFALSFATPTFASQTNGTIDDTAKYAWGDKLGWINFKPSQGGLDITDTMITGYAWSEHDGWINFSPTNGGVTNNTSGQLGGNAWSEGVGWISFSGVTIGSQGKFAGMAGNTNSTGGQINFDCTRCSVTTDWRPTGARAQVLQGHQAQTMGGSSSFVFHAQPIPLFPNLGLSPLTLSPPKGGHVIKPSKEGPIIVTVPSGAISEVLSFNIDIHPSSDITVKPPTSEAFLLNAVYYEIKAYDVNGREVHTFKKPLLITLPIPPGLQRIRSLAVYWLNEEQQVWEKIPNATFFADHVTITVDHLSRFAIFATRSSGIIKTPMITQGPTGGGIITEMPTVDTSKQAISIQRALAATPPQPQTETGIAEAPNPEQPPAGVDQNILVVITASLIALLAYTLAKQKIENEK